MTAWQECRRSYRHFIGRFFYLVAECNVFIAPNATLSKRRALTEKLVDLIMEYEGIENAPYKDYNNQIQPPAEINKRLICRAKLE
ncbi:MAG: hypothetical protein ACRBFS_03275 [Aureispira sp.]